MSGKLQGVLGAIEADGGTDHGTYVVIIPVPIRNGRRGGITAYSVPCGGCDHMIVVAARTYRDLRASGRRAYCDECKRPTAVMIREEHVRYWRERFDERDIRFMGNAVDSIADGLFGERIHPPMTPGAREELALAASAAARRRLTA